MKKLARTRAILTTGVRCAAAIAVLPSARDLRPPTRRCGRRRALVTPPAITAALAKGADVNAKSRYDVTALIFAAGSGRLEAVKLLIARGADVNAQDTFYRARAAEMAITNGHVDVTLYLLQNGADADGLLAMGVQQNQEAIVKAAAAGKVIATGTAVARSPSPAP